MRSRNIKPSFFSNEFLVALGARHAILFQALWVLADRRGVLEDRPGRIKLIAPLVGDLDVDVALNDLQRAPNRFIKRYTAGGVRLVKILNFRKHQNPHPDEKSSNFADYQAVIGLQLVNNLSTRLTPSPSSPSYPLPKDVGAAAATPPLRKPRKKKAKAAPRAHWNFVYSKIYDWLKAKKHGAVPGITSEEQGMLRNFYDGYGWSTVAGAWDLWIEPGNKWSGWAEERGWCITAFYCERGTLFDDARWKDRRDVYDKQDAAAYQPKPDEVPIGGLLDGMMAAITLKKGMR